MTSTDLELKRKRIETIAKVAGLCVFGFLFAPFAVATVTGLISLLVVGAIGLAAVNIGIPWASVTLANWRLKAIKAAAAANPIETLENQYKDREEALLRIRDNLKEFNAVVQELWNRILDQFGRRGNRFCCPVLQMRARAVTKVAIMNHISQAATDKYRAVTLCNWGNGLGKTSRIEVRAMGNKDYTKKFKSVAANVKKIERLFNRCCRKSSMFSGAA